MRGESRKKDKTGREKKEKDGGRRCRKKKKKPGKQQGTGPHNVPEAGGTEETMGRFPSA